ncbi:MAG TPA: rRNA maturation RNase YbeY [Chitinophagaceae bacterium]|nr:rRNA maturation RNase YbeY [Chitinophagaceae bacterium]
MKLFIESVFRTYNTKLKSINYIFTTDKRLLEINKQYLNHDYYTDIITFDLSDSNRTTAEVYISVDRVKENAKKNKVTFRHELYRVIFHGVLHLCGFNDKTKKEINRIRETEDCLIEKYTK